MEECRLVGFTFVLSQNTFFFFKPGHLYAKNEPNFVYPILIIPNPSHARCSTYVGEWWD